MGIDPTINWGVPSVMLISRTRPVELTVSELLEDNTRRLVELLQRQLELRQKKLEDELREVRALIAELNAILGSKARRMAIMKAAAKAAAEKKGVIIPKPKKPEKKEILIRDNKEVPEGTMTDAEKDERGPKFTGYWKGTDKGRPGKKMVGGGT